MAMTGPRSRASARGQEGKHGPAPGPLLVNKNLSLRIWEKQTCSILRRRGQTACTALNWVGDIPLGVNVYPVLVSRGRMLQVQLVASRSRRTRGKAAHRERTCQG